PFLFALTLTRSILTCPSLSSDVTPLVLYLPVLPPLSPPPPPSPFSLSLLSFSLPFSFPFLLSPSPSFPSLSSFLSPPLLPS
ncbi:hypothetical protein ACXWRS_11505, partial [Streptococcus pyogenes]